MILFASSAQADGLHYVAMTPCRAVDTRNGGQFGGMLQGGSTRAFALPQSTCSIPSAAKAYALSVTVVPQGPLEVLSVWPSDEKQPITSLLNSPDGRVKANAAALGADSSGSISVYASNNTHFILDISGYFVSDTSQLQFYPLAPCRFLDTRNGGQPFGTGETRDYALRTNCGIPSTAHAYSLNFTAIPVQGRPLGLLGVWPKRPGMLNTSTLNAPTGTVTANAAIVEAGTNGGEISVYASNPTDLVIDVNGYFADPSSSGQSFFPMIPCRVLDTRSSSGLLNGMLAVDIENGGCGLPADATAYVTNATVVPSQPLGFLQLWANGAQQPISTILNATDGAVTSNMALVNTTNGKIEANTTNPTQLILDLSGYFAPNDGPTVDDQLNQLWNGQASFQDVADMRIQTMMNNGSDPYKSANKGTQIIAVNGVWYRFNREMNWMVTPPPPTACAPIGISRVAVRSSTDHGQTWSSPEVVIATPNFSGSPLECFVGDGHAYFDPDTTTWHYVAQSYVTPDNGNTFIWNINHYTLQGQSPMSAFQPDPHNPVVTSGFLWNQICQLPGAHCPSGTSQEGTPEISFKRNGYFYMTFHGNLDTHTYLFDNQNQTQYTVYHLFRGMAKTKDFQTWIVNAPDLPNDVLWAPEDCSPGNNGWNNFTWDQANGCIGGGHASSLLTPQYTYYLSEAADWTNEYCNIPGQQWVGGLARSPSGFVPTGQWQQYVNNPILDSGRQDGCEIQYERLFTDGTDVYMTYWNRPALNADNQSWFHIAQLVPAADRTGKADNIHTTFSMVEAFDHHCDPLNHPVSTDCNTAIANYCASMGYDANGYGPNAQDAIQDVDETNVLCLGGGSAQSISTQLSSLPSCSSQPISLACNANIQTFCGQQGATSGFGPYDLTPDGSASFTCVQSSLAVNESTLLQALTNRNSGCTSSSPVGIGCNIAINGYCAARNFSGGYGLFTAVQGGNATFACTNATAR